MMESVCCVNMSLTCCVGLLTDKSWFEVTVRLCSSVCRERHKYHLGIGLISIGGLPYLTCLRTGRTGTYLLNNRVQVHMCKSLHE